MHSVCTLRSPSRRHTRAPGSPSQRTSTPRVPTQEIWQRIRHVVRAAGSKRTEGVEQRDRRDPERDFLVWFIEGH